MAAAAENRPLIVFRDLAISLAIACLTLLVAELVLHWAGVRYQASFFRMDPRIGYVYRPNSAGYWIGDDTLYTRINSHGHHDREHSVAKPAGTTRIAVVGASYVGGMQVPVEAVFPYVMQQLLNGRNGKRVEVLNFGCDAYSIGQAYYALSDVWQYQPDIVIYAITHIDIVDATRKTALNNWGAYRPFFELTSNGDVVPDRIARLAAKPTPQQIRDDDRRGEFLNRFDLALAVNAAYGKASSAFRRFTSDTSAAKTPPQDTGNPYILPLLPPPLNGAAEQDWRILEALIPKWVHDSKEHGAELWIIPTGTQEQENPDLSYREKFRQAAGIPDLFYWDKRVQQISERDGAHCLRLAPLMAEYAVKHHVYLHGFFYRPPGTGHWNVTGNRVAAQLIASALEQSSPRLRQ